MATVTTREPAVVHLDQVVRRERSGLVHEVAFDEALAPVPAQRVLVQRTYNEPGDFSGWHVHPDFTTYGYQLTGQLRVEYGADGGQVIECGATDFVRIPASCIQREGAIGTVARSGIGVRIGSGPPVVDVDGPDAALPSLGTRATVELVTTFPAGADPVVVREADLVRGEAMGLLREVAFEEDLPPIAGQRVLFERTCQDAGVASSWRSHPNYVRYAYQMTGHLRLDFGPDGSRSIEAGPGDFVRIPAGTRYREVTLGNDDRIAVGIRIGSGIDLVETDESP